MKNIVNETEKVHDETLQLMLKAQELMNKKMMHYEQIKAHIENDGDKIVNSEENFNHHLNLIHKLILGYEAQKKLIDSLFKVYTERLVNERLIKAELEKLKEEHGTIQ